MYDACNLLIINYLSFVRIDTYRFYPFKDNYVDLAQEIKIIKTKNGKIVLVLIHQEEEDILAYFIKNDTLVPITDFLPKDYLQIFFKNQELMEKCLYDEYDDMECLRKLYSGNEINGDHLIVRIYLNDEDSIYLKGNTQILAFDSTLCRMRTEKVYWEKRK